MKKIVVIFFVLLFVSCTTMRFNKVASDDKDKYLITKIKKKNSYIFIYATRNDTNYKIVSSFKDTIVPGGTKIHRGGKYKFNLESYKEQLTKLNENFWPVGYTGCFYLDSITSVCLEPENDIWDIHSCSNLKGLYIY